MKWNHIILAGFVFGFFTYTAHLYFQSKQSEPLSEHLISEEITVGLDCGIMATISVLAEMAEAGEPWQGAATLRQKTRDKLDLDAKSSGRRIPWPKSGDSDLPQS